MQEFLSSIKEKITYFLKHNLDSGLVLLGLTPNEVFDGKLPDVGIFKNEIVKAKQQRTAKPSPKVIIENRKDICLIHE